MNVLYAALASVLLASLLSACSTTEYIMSTTEGRLIVSSGRPDLDEKSGTYTYKDANGKEATIPKTAIVQIMER